MKLCSMKKIKFQVKLLQKPIIKIIYIYCIKTKITDEIYSFSFEKIKRNQNSETPLSNIEPTRNHGSI